MILLANRYYGYQILDCSRHTVKKKHLNDVKKQSAMGSKFLKKLWHVNDQLYEVELAKAEVEQKEAFFVGIIILHYTKLRMLELYYNFCDTFCDFNSFEVLETDTHSLPRCC